MNLITKEYEDYLIKMRRHFHMHPELSCQEVETEKTICEELDKMGLPWIHIDPHNVIATLEGEPGGKKMMMRGDIDALPMKEETGLPFSSINDDACHSCGHDTHTAITLTAAKYLSEHHEGLKGTIYFFFECSEESMGHGACDAIPFFKEVGLDMALGMHTWEQMKAGTICVEPGTRAAGTGKFDITIIGQGSHGSRPDLGVDPIRPACNIVEAMSSIPSNMHYAQDPLVVNIARFNSGTANNVVPETANFGGTIRYFTSSQKDILDKKVKNLVNGIANAYGARADIKIAWTHGAVKNSQEASEVSVRAASQIEGLEIIHQDADMGSDDFSMFTDNFSGMYAHLGTGTGLPGQYAQHHPKYMIDETALKYGAEFYVRFAKEYLHF